MAPACNGIKVPTKRNFSIFDSKTVFTEEKKRKEGDSLKIVSWNVAGLRACVKKNGHIEIAKLNADIVILQETKCTEFPPEFSLLKELYSFKKLCVSKEKNGGYAGVGILAREKPISIEYGVNDENFDNQGRIIQAEFDNFYLLGVYVPNSGQKLVNLSKRSNWESIIREKLKKLDAIKPVLYIGDMNVAHKEIDLKNPVLNRNKTAGFTDQEREDFTKILDLGFVDVFRKRNPEKKDAYTFWSYMGNARSKNIGWRIDYFVVSERIYNKVIDTQIHHEILGSDHCPISLIMEL